MRQVFNNDFATKSEQRCGELASSCFDTIDDAQDDM